MLSPIFSNPSARPVAYCCFFQFPHHKLCFLRLHLCAQNLRFVNTSLRLEAALKVIRNVRRRGSRQIPLAISQVIPPARAAAPRLLRVTDEVFGASSPFPEFSNVHALTLVVLFVVVRGWGWEKSQKGLSGTSTSVLICFHRLVCVFLLLWRWWFALLPLASVRGSPRCAASPPCAARLNAAPNPTQPSERTRRFPPIYDPEADGGADWAPERE